MIVSQNDGMMVGSEAVITVSAADGSTPWVVNTIKPPALNVKKLHPEAKLPTKAHINDLAYDLYALEDVTLRPGMVTKVRTGIACGFPTGMGALIRDRSSVATKQGVFVVAGVIDNEYTGEILVAFFNPLRANHYVVEHGDGACDYTTEEYEILSPKECEIEFKAGDKIAQMILTPTYTYPVEEVDDLGETTRGEKGFGSSGR
jgi:dUTP pyrophosphatase